MKLATRWKRPAAAYVNDLLDGNKRPVNVGSSRRASGAALNGKSGKRRRKCCRLYGLQSGSCFVSRQMRCPEQPTRVKGSCSDNEPKELCQRQAHRNVTADLHTAPKKKS